MYYAQQVYVIYELSLILCLLRCVFPQLSVFDYLNIEYLIIIEIVAAKRDLKQY